MDRFYTSPELADALVGLTTTRRRALSIADFACGEGSLLLAAERRWPAASMIANDVSAASIASLRKSRPKWQAACSDFLNPRSVRSSALRNHLKGVDLVLLNPPFSRRNRQTFEVAVGDEVLHASIAMAFVVNSIPFLRPDGAILAVLPDGCLVSKHDEPVWRALRKQFNVEVIRDNSRSAFQGVRARTCLVRMTRLNARVSVAEQVTAPFAPTISRGRVQMHSRKVVSDKLGKPLVHTHHLRNGVVASSGLHVEGAVVSGPALLFPRVGLVTPGKLCVLRKSQRVTLSDCVLGVVCKSETDAETLRQMVLASWPTFASAYRGTGAPYITVERASAVLAEIWLTARSPSAVLPSDVLVQVQLADWNEDPRRPRKGCHPRALTLPTAVR
ncbi:methyltransferase [Variovorax paradoxus]|uniref:methyltransferase n=1 Tax=Variovorax paradoxus TaxID=34073 RepID=UPI003F5134FD